MSSMLKSSSAGGGAAAGALEPLAGATVSTLRPPPLLLEKETWRGNQSHKYIELNLRGYFNQFKSNQRNLNNSS